MKSTPFLAGFLLLLSSVLFTRCTADRGSVSTPREIIVRGSWGIQSFYAAGEKADEYAGYAFTFGPEKTVTVRNSTGQTTGSWRWIQNVRTEVLDLQLPDHPGLAPLSDRWTLEQSDLRTLTLRRGTDVLTLQQLPLP